MAAPSARRALGRVISVAREELADRDVDAIPHRLRRVAASSARNLPPPLEKSLVDAIVGDEAFRSAVIDRWDAASVDDALGRAFLEDPTAGLALIEAEVSIERDRSTEASMVALTDRVGVLEAELAEAKRRIVAGRESAAAELSAAKAADHAARRSLERAASQAAAEAERARLEADQEARRAASLEMEIAELTSVVERLTARDRRREGGVRTRGRGIQESSPTGARGLAVALDASERSMRPYREATSDDGRDAPIPAWRLGTGVAPDRAESVDAVLAMVPRTILIDGYNVAASLDVKDFATRSGRDRVLVAANTLARATTAEVIVVFDAAGVDGRGTYRGDLGVSIRFSTQQSADDLIVALVERGTRSVVVSNDRELRERAEALGALAIWADALVGWISLRGRGSNP